MSGTPLLLVRFTDRERLLPALQAIESLPEQPGRYALDGHYNLAVCLGDGMAELEPKLNEALQDAEITRLELAEPGACGQAPDPDACHVLLCLETAPSSADQAKSILGGMPGCAWCVKADGPYDLVAMLSGETFSALDKAIEQHIHPYPGIVRYKVNRVINLDEL